MYDVALYMDLRYFVCIIIVYYMNNSYIIDQNFN